MRQRRLAQPAFYKKRLNDLFSIMEDQANKMIEDLLPKRGETVSITDVFWKVTSVIVIKTLLGGDGPDENEEIQHAIFEIQEYIIKRVRSPYLIPWMYLTGERRKFNKILENFDRWIYEIIDERRKSGKRGNDLLSMLMEAHDEDTGEFMSDKQLRDEFITIYVAGHETSSYALSWTMYLLAQHPEVVHKIKEEVLTIPDIDNIGFEGLRSLSYINQVLTEGMRLYPPAWIVGRMVKEDTIIDNTPIKKGQNILLSIYAVHRDRRFWDDPESFKPERFAPELHKKRDKFTYIPFGAGPRMCIGNNFAIMEITMILAKLFHHFDFELTPGQTIEPDPLVTLRPKYGIKLDIN